MVPADCRRSPRNTKDMRKQLTPKQEVFVDETIATLNPTEAARRAYNIGKKGDMSIEQINNTARSIASENLTKPNVKAAFDAKLRGFDDTVLLDELGAVAMSSDLRAKLQAIDMLLKLKDRYPASKMKFQAAFEERERVIKRD